MGANFESFFSYFNLLGSRRGLPLPCFHTKCVPILPELFALVSVCGGAFRAAGVPSVRMKGLSGGTGDGRC